MCGPVQQIRGADELVALTHTAVDSIAVSGAEKIVSLRPRHAPGPGVQWIINLGLRRADGYTNQGWKQKPAEKPSDHSDILAKGEVCSNGKRVSSSPHPGHCANGQTPQT